MSINSVSSVFRQQLIATHPLRAVTKTILFFLPSWFLLVPSIKVTEAVSCANISNVGKRKKLSRINSFMRRRRHLNSNSHAAGEQARHTATLFNSIDFSSFQNKSEHTVIASGVMPPPTVAERKGKSHSSNVRLCLNTREERQVIRYYSCHESFFFFILLLFES